uniref:Sodefrin-like factor beta isoform 24 n=1 Tax=Notophthalmus viridescens TaxID=8316 RepID=A0A0A0QU84_NOTVI|nr:sodefrin precursor-like factor beta isoform 24 [Notophthalmus viridescens]
MRAILAAVVMLQALITGADCLLCEQCFVVGSSQCSGIFKQCSPDVTHCVKGMENSTLGTRVVLSAFKDCLNPSQKAACGREFFHKDSALFFQITRTCCDSDFCNKRDVEVPAVDNTPNGYKCEDCFTTQSTGPCTATGGIQCTGEQNTCGSFSGGVARPGEVVRQISMKGCVSPDFCDLFYPAATQVYNYDLLCSPAEKL